MSATLGGLLKDYRLQKNLSQMEIAFALGWREPSRLSRIEQGKVGNPSRELLDKIMAVMELKEEEKNHLLLVGNYLPTKEEISRAQKQTDLLIKNWPYPASVMDFSWRVVHVNKPLELAYQVAHKEYVKKEKLIRPYLRYFLIHIFLRISISEIDVCKSGIISLLSFLFTSYTPNGQGRGRDGM